MTARRLLPLAILAACGALALSGCSVIDSIIPKPAETRDAQSGEIIGGGTTDVFTLQPGDCLSYDSVSDEVTDVPTVPCSEPHQYEVYGEVVLEGDEFPGDDVINQQADDGCYAQFAAFAGIAYEDSVLDYTYYTPLQEGWEQLNDRLVTCLVFDTGETTGSLAGAAR